MEPDAPADAPPLPLRRKWGIALLVVLDLAWLVVYVMLVTLLEAISSGTGYDAGWRIALALVAAAVPPVLLLRSRGQGLLLAWGVFLVEALVMFGVCVAGA